MASFVLELYNEAFLTLTRGCGKGRQGKSNAKPIFLLAVMECVAMKTLVENKLFFDDKTLMSTYYAFARYYDEPEIAPMILPYFHFHTSSFYHLVWKESFRPPFKHAHPSGKYLAEHLSHAELDPELWSLLQNAENRDYLKQNIVKRYLTER